MDSMRSLNTSLPRATPRRPAAGPQAPEDILTAFKAAALSVTTLYRAAANDQVRSRAAGYQDALDDLLAFLDKENIGLGDGEGWRVRQWATERLDGSERAENDDDEEEAQEEERLRHQSPELVRETAHRQTEQTTQQQTPTPSEPTSTALPPPTVFGSTQQQAPTTPPAFVFRSAHTYPTNHDREMNMDSNETPDHEQQTYETQAETPVRMELPPKQRARQNRNTISRSTTSNRALGSGAGTKRRVPFDDFFNISGLNFDTTKDGSERGGKRGRHV
ncbi:hypothetical protein MBLNU457_1552t1 [Dothideomycetes sp. NU457]